MTYGVRGYGVRSYGDGSGTVRSVPTIGSPHSDVVLVHAEFRPPRDATAYVYENVGFALGSSRVGLGYAYENVGFALPPQGWTARVLAAAARNPRYGVAYAYENVIFVLVSSTDAVGYVYEDVTP